MFLRPVDKKGLAIWFLFSLLAAGGAWYWLEIDQAVSRFQEVRGFPDRREVPRIRYVLT